MACAAPFAGWSDLGYALRPNGRTHDSDITPVDADLLPAGVQKQSINAGLYLAGNLFGYYPPAGTDPDADPITWFAHVSAGEPYESVEDEEISEQFARFPGLRWHNPLA